MSQEYRLFQPSNSSSYITANNDNYTRSNRSTKWSSRKGSADYESNLKFKTQACKYWLNRTKCPFGYNCNFAHGDTEIRSKDFVPSKYKTKVCHKFTQQGYCVYGSRCQFIHPTRKMLKINFSSAVECIAQDSDMFFCYLQHYQENTGNPHRLSFFSKMSSDLSSETANLISSIMQMASSDDYNYVDVRSRHNSI